MNLNRSRTKRRMALRDWYLITIGELPSYWWKFRNTCFDKTEI